MTNNNNTITTASAYASTVDAIKALIAGGKVTKEELEILVKEEEARKAKEAERKAKEEAERKEVKEQATRCKENHLAYLTHGKTAHEAVALFLKEQSYYRPTYSANGAIDVEKNITYAEFCNAFAKVQKAGEGTERITKVKQDVYKKRIEDYITLCCDFYNGQVNENIGKIPSMGKLKKELANVGNTLFEGVAFPVRKGDVERVISLALQANYELNGKKAYTKKEDSKFIPAIVDALAHAYYGLPYDVDGATNAPEVSAPAPEAPAPEAA